MLSESRAESKESREIVNDSKTDDSIEITEDPGIDVTNKDDYGAIPVLREAIDKRFKIIESLGKGSYGMVAKAVCLKTGR